MHSLQKLIIKGGARCRIHKAAEMLEHFRFETAKTKGSKIKEVVFESATSVVQTLSEILMIVDRADYTSLKCEVFKVSALAGLILDIDISGLSNREKLE